MLKKSQSRRGGNQQRHGKKLNPYSTTGLDKFESVYAELSAKREYIAHKTGAPEAMVRFIYSEKGWVPVVLANRGREIGTKNSGGDAARDSIVVPAENNNNETGGELRKKNEGNGSVSESQIISISVVDERCHSLVIPWSRFLKKKAFGILSVMAMWVKLIVNRSSFLAALFRNPNPSEKVIVEQEHGSRKNPLPSAISVSELTSPLRADGNLTDFWATTSPRAANPRNIYQSKAKQYRRAVSMDNQPTRPERSDCFCRPAKDYEANVGATFMIITLLFFALYGPFCAIFFICASIFLFKMKR